MQERRSDKRGVQEKSTGNKCKGGVQEKERFVGERDRARGVQMRSAESGKHQRRAGEECRREVQRKVHPLGVWFSNLCPGFFFQQAGETLVDDVVASSYYY